MDSLLVKPSTWSVVKSKKCSGGTSIQFFGYTENDKSVYIRIPFISTVIIEYTEPVTQEEAVEISEGTVSDSVSLSTVDDKILILTNPDIANSGTAYDEEEITRDPCGELSSFFQQKGIAPYQWLEINNLLKTKVRYNTDRGYSTFDRFVEKGSSGYVPIHKVLFWDIETYTDAEEFTNSERDPVTLISVVTSDGKNPPKGYLLTRLKMNDFDQELTVKTEIIRYNSEKDMIKGFLNLWKKFGPDRSVTYNGYSYDIPYMLDRIDQLDIKIGQLGKINGLDSWITTEKIKTGAGPEWKRRWNNPGVEEIDLLMYFRLRYPYFPNHKLDTVGNKLISWGKTGLDIEEMFNFFKRNDPKEMMIAGYYSITDSILLYNLYYGAVRKENNNIINGDVEYDLELLSNKCHVTAEDLLLKTPAEVISNLGYRVDPGTVLRDPSVPLSDGNSLKYNGDFYIKPKFGIYTNVYNYDYSPILYDIMKHSFDFATQISADVLDTSGITLAKALWDSDFTQTNSQHVESYLNRINEMGIIVDLNKNSLVTIAPIENPLLVSEGKYKLYAILSKTSRYVINHQGVITCHGRSEICKPTMTIEENLISDWAQSILDKSANLKFIPITAKTPVNMLVRKIKLSLGDESSNNELKNELYKQIQPITTFKSVKYVHTLKGPEIFKGQKISDMDLDKYNDILKKSYDKLIKLQGRDFSNVLYND